MSEKESYEISITVYSYKDIVDKFKEKNNFTNEEVKDRLEQELQVLAWVDAYTNMQSYLDWENSSEGKKFIEEQEKKESTIKHRRNV